MPDVKCPNCPRVFASLNDLHNYWRMKRRVSAAPGLPDGQPISRAERRARAWYAQSSPSSTTWEELPEAKRQQFITTAGQKDNGRCNAPECGGDCLECFEEKTA